MSIFQIKQGVGLGSVREEIVDDIDTLIVVFSAAIFGSIVSIVPWLKAVSMPAKKKKR